MDLSKRLEITVLSKEIRGFIKVLKSFRKLDIRKVKFSSVGGVESCVGGSELC